MIRKPSHCTASYYLVGPPRCRRSSASSPEYTPPLDGEEMVEGAEDPAKRVDRRADPQTRADISALSPVSVAVTAGYLASSFLGEGTRF